MRNHQPPTTRPAPSLHLPRRTAALQRWGLIYFSNDSFNGVKIFSNGCMKLKSLNYCVWIANVVPAQNKVCLLANSRFSWVFFVLFASCAQMQALCTLFPCPHRKVFQLFRTRWTRCDVYHPVLEMMGLLPLTHILQFPPTHIHTHSLSHSWTASLIPIKYVSCVIDYLLPSLFLPLLPFSLFFFLSFSHWLCTP